MQRRSACQYRVDFVAQANPTVYGIPAVAMGTS